MKPTNAAGIVLAGGGLAAQRCAETLRRDGYDGSIKMLCSEPHRPYDRPPLSKELLTGQRHAERLPFRPAAWYEAQQIELLLGTAASGLSVSEHCVELTDGSALRYDKLLIATGSRPRMLPSLCGYENVSVLRTVDDGVRLREVLVARPHLAVLGAGFIGQEVAATARRLGAEVTMIEAAPCPLYGVLGEQLGGWFTRLHRHEGVEVLTGSSVDGIEANGGVQAIRLASGRRVEADHLVVGIGVQAEVDWLNGSGLERGGGVHVDTDGRTAAPDVFAAGDAAATYDRRLGARVSGSHWEAAGRQGARAAKAMLGLSPGRPQLTSFWTDQYGIRIQYLGHARLADSVTVDGELEARSFTAIFTQAGRPVAALLVDRPRSLPAVRKQLENGEPQ